jgi:hypothetical protein
LDRRHFLLTSCAAAGGVSLAGLGACATTAMPGRLDPEIAELQERTFRWFWDVTPHETGLTPDRAPSLSFCSVAAVGDALTCWPIGIENGWITREQGRQRTLNTMRFFYNAPQGPEPRGVTGYKGFFYHFLEMDTGHRFGTTELSTVDTALLVAGMLFAARYFDQDHPDEAEIRQLAEAVYARVEWPWAQPYGDAYITMGWHPETGFIEHRWEGYNEAMVVILMALGSPTHPVSPQAWTTWCSTYDTLSWTDRRGQPHLHFAPMFGHQYSHKWVDFRGILDPYMRDKGFDYFENSRRATYAQQAYARENPGGWAGYSDQVWGLTACDGPGDFTLDIAGREREFFSYSARGPGERDDGTIAPTAAAASIAFAPEIVIPCVKAIKARYPETYTRYGFLDAFNPTLTDTGGNALLHGSVDPRRGWVADEYLGIDQGPIVIMIENHKSDLVWRLMRTDPHLRRGLERAGFSGGWLSA